MSTFDHQLVSRELEKLADDDTGEAAAQLLRLLHEHGLTNPTLLRNGVRKFSKLQLSFSKVTWAHIQKLFRDPKLRKVSTIPRCEIQSITFDEKTLRAIHESISSQELVAGKLTDAKNEAHVVAWVNAAVNPLVTLFGGAVNLVAEGALKGHNVTTGGYIEFLFYVLDIVVIVAIECKRIGPHPDDIAQMMVELNAAWLTNVSDNVKTPVVRGILASPSSWSFFEHNGETFSRSKEYFIAEDEALRYDALGCFYALLLCGYIDALQALILRSSAEAKAEGVERRASYPKWVTALDFAKKAWQRALGDEDFGVVNEQLSESIQSLPDDHQIQPKESADGMIGRYKKRRLGKNPLEQVS
ncbi:hypothetical protein BDZ88DRAFT_456312 [Geranomyces variabilis]|nr:hypothetical protein BDZ88DRAFT_456312 [Geranomyces variabilis]KAJ3134964.1 hypothetical protein HDU90_004289 [Geranomyces variabilis]